MPSLPRSRPPGLLQLIGAWKGRYRWVGLGHPEGGQGCLCVPRPDYEHTNHRQRREVPQRSWLLPKSGLPFQYADQRPRA
jgi:hypothetical protein